VTVARRWLPWSALTLVACRRALTPLLDAWSTSWLPEGRIRLSDIRPLEPPSHASDLPFIRSGMGVSCSMTMLGKRLLFEAAAGMDLSLANLSPSEHRVIDEVVAEMADDLLSRLASLGGEPAAPEAPRMTLGCGFPDRELFRLDIATSALAEWVRESWPARSRRSEPLVPRLASIGSARVPLEARIGSSSLTLTELQSLSPGDVLILDQSLEEGVEVKPPGRDDPILRARLAPSGGSTPALLF